MPSILPTLDKTWQKSFNNYAGGVSLTADMRQMWRAMQKEMTGQGPKAFTSPWTTSYSCNGGASPVAGSPNDGQDRWTADANLVWNYLGSGAARSWYVFQNNNIGSGFQMLWDLELNLNSNQGNFERYIYISISPSAGFTGGSTTARPSATDEVLLFSSTTSGATWCGSGIGSSAANYRWHMWHSSDGQCSMFVIYQNSAVLARLNVGRLKNPTSGWTAPNWWASFINQSGGAGTSSANSFSALFNAAWGKTRINGINVTNGTYTTEGTAVGPLGSYQTWLNDIDLSYKFAPIGVFSPNILGTRGHHGTVYDVWAGVAQAPDGTPFPGDGTRQFVQFGSEIFPWDGTSGVQGSLPLVA